MERKVRMKEMVKRMAIAVTAVAVIFGSVSVPATVEAKGTAFINKKVSNVTPTIKSAIRKDGNVSVTVTVPKAKVKKLGNVKKVTVAYGSTNNSKKFEAKKATVKVTKKGSNQYTFTIKNKKLASYKNAYLTVQLGKKSNWSKLYKIANGSTSVQKYKYLLCCNGCDWQVEGNNLGELEDLHGKHASDEDAKYFSQYTAPYSKEVVLNSPNHDSYTWYKLQ